MVASPQYLPVNNWVIFGPMQGWTRCCSANKDWRVRNLLLQMIFDSIPTKETPLFTGILN